MKKAQVLVFAGALLLLAGCGTAHKQVVLRSEILSSDGTPIAVSQSRAVVRPQYVPREEEDPLVAQARAVGRQQAKQRDLWEKACLALRQGDPYATYSTCRQVLGDDRSISTGNGYYGGGRMGAGSILSTPGVNWLY